MALPVISPIYHPEQHPSPFEVIAKVTSSQKRPYDIPTLYYKYYGQGYRRGHSNGMISPVDPYILWIYQNNAAQYYDLYQRTYATAFDRLVSKVRGKHTASLGTSLAEVSESAAMVANRAGSMVKAWTSFRKGRLGDVYDALSLKTPVAKRRVTTAYQKARRGSLDFSNAFLELSFGWQPLIQDIYDAIDTLQNADFKSGPVRGTAVSMIDEEKVTRFDWGTHTVIQTQRNQGSLRVSVGCKVHISNPNVALANQLGLVNPALVAWNVIPFSYLVNWFIPVDSFLESFSWDWGFSTTDFWISRYKVGSFYGDELFSNNQGYTDYLNAWCSDRTAHGNYVPVPKFFSRVKLPGGDLLGKASTSVAVLIQQLTQRK